MLRSNAEDLIRSNMARFVDNEVIPRAQEIDESGEFPIDMFRKLAKMGVFGTRYPKNKGGSGGNTTLFCINCEELARGLMSGDEDGMLKLLVSPGDRRLLGVHVIGTGATDLVHIGQAVMGGAATIDFLVTAVFNYPTFAESYKVAALDAANRIRAMA